MLAGAVGGKGIQRHVGGDAAGTAPNGLQPDGIVPAVVRREADAGCYGHRDGLCIAIGAARVV